jgi:transposase
MEYIGIDVHQRESQVCIVDGDGHVLLERRVRTRGERFGALLEGRGHARVVLEASTESEWVAQALEALGYEVIVADPNFAPMYATRSRRVKTDRRDARTLADACRLGAYRATHRTSAAQRTVRAQLAVREALVRTRTRYISVLRAVLRRDGIRVPSGGAATFGQRVQTLPLSATQARLVAPLVALLKPLNRQLAALEAQLARGVAANAAARRLCTVPGVGPVTAAAVVATLDDVSRFASAGQADRAPSGRPDAQPNSNRPPSAAGVTENSGRTSLTAASTAASRAASSRPGSWWNGTRCFTPASRAKASASWIVLCPQPTWRGYSSRVYCASWSSRSTPRARSRPEVHSGSRGNRRAPSAGSWSGRYASEAVPVSIR